MIIIGAGLPGTAPQKKFLKRSAATSVTGADFRAGGKGRGKKGLVDVRHVA
jgi:hypothetical protein